MSHSFFDYKANIEYEPWSDFFSTTHIIFLSIAVLLIVFLCIFLRNVSHKKIDTYLKVLSIIMPLSEITKIVWETIYDLKYVGHFNSEGLLPLYTCSMFFMILIPAAWAKGKVKDISLAFITTLSIFAGLTNFIYLNILGTYPFLTYASLNSFVYHFMMVFTGIFLVTTSYYRPHLKDALYAFIPVIIFSCLVIPINFIIKNMGFNPNYMMYMDGQGLPVLEPIETFFTSKNLTLIYTFIVMIGYYLIILLLIGIFNLIDYLKKILKKDPSLN